MIIAFLMDRLDTIDPLDSTTSHLMYECHQRGHTVYFLEPHDIYIRDGQVVARMRHISVAPNMAMGAYWSAVSESLQKEERVFESVTELDALLLRKRPPLNYQTMEFLAPIEHKVFMFNCITGIIQGNSKMYALNFPEITPQTHVSRDPDRLRKIIGQFGGAMMIKPLTRCGGEGVIKVSTQDRENLNSLIHYYTHANRVYEEREPIMVQEYLGSIREEGTVRLLLLDGEVLGAMRRVPNNGDFRFDVHAGGTLLQHTVTPAQREICDAVRDRLRADGLYFVSLDLIGNRLIRINCVSPGGIPQINALDGNRLEVRVIDLIEAKVRARARCGMGAHTDHCALN